MVIYCQKKNIKTIKKEMKIIITQIRDYLSYHTHRQRVKKKWGTNEPPMSNPFPFVLLITFA